jgi:hypothetical protein
LRGRWTPPTALDEEEKVNTDEDSPMDLEIATEFAGPHYHRAAQVSVTVDDPGLLRLATAYLRGEGHVVEVSTTPSATRSDGLEAARIFVLQAELAGLDVEDIARELHSEAPGAFIVAITNEAAAPALAEVDAVFSLPRQLGELAEAIQTQLHGPSDEASTWLPMPLNRETIARLSEGQAPQVVAGRIDAFVDEFPTWLAGLVRSVGRAEWNATRSTCARMSQSASALGADRLADLAQVVHSLAGRDGPMAERVVDALDREFCRVRQALRLTRAQFLRASTN